MKGRLDQVGKLATELAIDTAIKYVRRDPDRNLGTLLDFADRLASEEQREGVARLRDRLVGDPAVMEQIRRVAKNPRMLQKFFSNWVVNYLLLGPRRRRELGERLGVHIPNFLLIDPTSACNLRCSGCWAGEYPPDTWEVELFERVLSEAEELGISWIVLSGGEPFAYKPLLEGIERHPNLAFMAYTNGTLITEEVADRLAELGTLSPAISLEGFKEVTDSRRGEGIFDQVVEVMDRLRERGVLFGASVTVTRQNVEELFSYDFIDFLVEKGAVYIWSFHYIPVGRNPDLDLMLTTEQRLWLKRRVDELRATRPLLIADFWNDGYAVGGCIAGGRMYLHINAAGECEPCAFVHFATDNIREKSLQEVLAGPLLRAFQKRQPFYPNHLAPCPIIDNPEMLREIVAESGAHPTHPGAEEILRGETATFLDCRSAAWRRVADDLMAEQESKVG